ncbi:AMP-binding protein [Pontimicrobium aquaticum]|uniref:O-succinylbenzoic acid--CoA ligase n=1 Tax=Pontimicrobium aquaticum TaxID=2565367 RepID=A0A4U0EQP9_9FLAO|nr:AMP-binding protein [Pontimicrobium aquaticum]TJY34007.1 O-succinylbenzoic acid--CoA ligase [Pontimicrobium aquaticum]
MIPHFNKIHNRFKLNGEHYNQDVLKEVAADYIKEGEPYQKVIGDFLLDWLNNKDDIKVTTSGSTGSPKLLALKKQSMVHSALATGDYFGLAPGDTALHCLPTGFIAGKMMLVRALILGLELDIVEPSAQPLAFTSKPYDFCAMVPLQLQQSITQLNYIKTLIVGGALVTQKLQNQIQDTSCHVYATYGMTETVTHIAVKKLNNVPSLRGGTTKQSVEEAFKILPNISIETDERDCLVINAPRLTEHPVVTNDIVELTSKNSFKLLGRVDNVINSGGVKLFPEQIEEKLAQVIETPFFVASKKNDSLGESLILVVEGLPNTDHLKTAIKGIKNLDKYEIPKEILSVPQFVTTASGKLQRKLTLELLQ